jgi:predicted metal-dependent HD superfamily phosphohydrolase
MLEDLLVGLLESQPDLKVIRGAAAGDLAAAASAAKAEVIVTAHREPADFDAIDSALARAANLSVLAIAPDGASAYLHKIRCETSRLDDVTAEEILRALVASNPIR